MTRQQEDDALGLGLTHEDLPPPRRHRNRFVVLLAALLVILTVAGVVTLGVRLVLGIFGPPPDYPGPGTGTVVVQVHTGDTTNQIADTLAADGVVKSAAAFAQVAAQNKQALSIEPGYYRLRHRMRAALALGLLLDPAARISIRVTIPEGTQLSRALTLLAAGTRLPLSALQAVAAHPAVLGLPPACQGQLEGCVFPATYLFPPGTTAVQVLSETVQRFIVAADAAGLVPGAAALRLTPYQVLIVASLIEREARFPADFPKVARVIYNRLARGMPLQLDSTVNYALHANKTRVTINDTRVRSPYNTYLHRGLPPTPIDSPGMLALQAALHPTPGGWIYFVTIDKAGHNAFAVGYRQFLQLKALAAQNGQ